MKKLLLFALAITLFSLKAAYNQEVYKLAIIQPPPISYSIFEAIDVNEGESINLDTLFNVEGDISYAREWKFNNGIQLQTIENSIITIIENGTFHLTIIDEYGCTTLDSIALNVVTDIESVFSDPNNPLNIHIYPNPNSGTFDILIPDCIPGYTIQVINSLGIRILNRTLECNNNDYLETIKLPRREPGIHYILVRKDKKIIYKQKVIILQ